MRLSVASEAMTVEAGAPLVNTESGTVSTVIRTLAILSMLSAIPCLAARRRHWRTVSGVTAPMAVQSSLSDRRTALDPVCSEATILTTSSLRRPWIPRKDDFAPAKEQRVQRECSRAQQDECGCHDGSHDQSLVCLQDVPTSSRKPGNDHSQMQQHCKRAAYSRHESEQKRSAAQDFEYREYRVLEG